MSKFSDKQSVPEELKNIANSFWSFFVFNRRMAIMIGLMFVVIGSMSFMKMPVESEPEVNIPYGMVITPYMGASPTEVAEQVTFKIEQKLKSLEDVKKMTSTSSEGISQIFIEFDAKADIDDSIRRLKDKVDEAKTNLPADAEDPSVQELSFSSRPIITFSFFGDLPYEQLLDVVETTKDQLEKIKGIQSADIVGKREKHILVAVREADMMQYGLSLRVINQAISSFHMNSPVGNIVTDEMIYSVRIEADQESVDHVKNIPIVSKNGATIYVKDVANVNEEFEEATTLSRVSVNGEPSKQAISINIVKKTGANVIETAKEAKEAIKKLKETGGIPASVESLEINDMAEFAETDFNNLKKNAFQTIILIFIILLFALGFKEAIVAGLAIPFTFLVAFSYLYQAGHTLNSLVLFGLILGLGLLVDTAIIMMEGFHDFFYKQKLSSINAALMTIKTYRYPLMAGTLTTISAFAPMLMMSGIMGEFFKYLPITISAVLFSSLFIGLLIIPAYAVLFMRKKKDSEKKNNKYVEAFITKKSSMMSSINQKYTALLSYLLNKKKRRLSLYAIAVGAFISAMLLPAVGLVKIEGFPVIDIDFMYVDGEAPVGTTLDKMDPIMQKVENVILEDHDIDSYVLNLGVGGTDLGKINLGPTASSTHLASMSINFIDKDKRDFKSYEIAENLKEKLAFITEAKINVPELRSGPSGGAAIQVLVFGEDYKVLKEISTDIQSELKGLGGQQVDDNMTTGTAEFTFDFNDPYQKTVLKNHNLSVLDVAQEVRMAVYPTKAASIKRGDEEIDIDIQKEWGTYHPSSIDEVKEIQIQNKLGEYIALGNITDAEMDASLTSIQHYDGDRAITISSDPSLGQTVDEILVELKPYLKSYEWPAGYSYEITGGNDDIMQSFRDLFNAMGLGLLLIILILITQFNSFKQPFAILMALPLSLIGVLYGFMFLGLSIGVGTMIGIVALSGIVINDAIVLIDRINQNRRQRGMGLRDAIIEAGPARLQPIVITSITTIFGILPISLTDPFWLTLGMAIVFGMLFSTVLTLIIIPNIYYTLEVEHERKSLIQDGLTPDQINELI